MSRDLYFNNGNIPPGVEDPANERVSIEEPFRSPEIEEDDILDIDTDNENTELDND